MNNLRIIIFAALALAVSVGATFAYGELVQFEGIEGRDYHARFHKKARCGVCHEESEPVSYPDDGVCLECHDMDELIAATARDSEEDVWQNPHNNLHYGQDVPCVECHGEHSNKEPLCADCHNFDYPNHEK